MKIKCKNCLPKEGIEIPDFTQHEKQILWKMRLDSPLHVIKELIKDSKYSHLEAKYIEGHINKEYGKCNCCNFENLVGEYVLCPKCKALNFNWNINDLDG